MFIKRIDTDLFISVMLMISGVDRRGWADRVHQTDGIERGGLRTTGKVHAVEIRQRMIDRIDLIAVGLEEVSNLAVGVSIHNGRRPVEMT